MRRFAAWAPREPEWAFLMVCILAVVSICIAPGLEVEQHYCIHWIGISQIHSVYLFIYKAYVRSRNTKKPTVVAGTLKGFFFDSPPRLLLSCS